MASSIPRANSPEPSTRKRKRGNYAGNSLTGSHSNQKKPFFGKKNPVESVEDGESDRGTTTIVHESLKESSSKDKASAKLKYAPADETPEQRDARTIFVGNLPIEVAQKKVTRLDVMDVFIIHAVHIVPT
jgi:RNA recognition motif-containing protein